MLEWSNAILGCLRRSSVGSWSGCDNSSQPMLASGSVIPRVAAYFYLTASNLSFTKENDMKVLMKLMDFGYSIISLNKEIRRVSNQR
jgi:hypothetical protein